MRPYLLAVSIVLSIPFVGQSALADESVPPVEPQIVIRHDENKTFYEYRVNGIVKEIKVVPEVGPTYYLVPSDGSGWIREDRSQVLVPKWILFKW